MDGILPARVVGAIVAAVACSALAAFVYLKNRNEPSNRYFAYFNFSLAIWNVGELFVLFTGNNPSLALGLDRFSYFGATAMIPWYLELVSSVTGNGRARQRIKEIVHQVFFIAFVILSVLLPTSFIIKSVNPAPHEEVPGPLFVVFAMYFIAGLVVGIFEIVSAYERSSTIDRNRLKYFFCAFIVGGIAACNYLLSCMNTHIAPIYHYLEILYCIILAYAIVKHRLLDINIVIRKTLLYSLVSAALASVYVGTITVLAQVLEASHGPATVFSSAVAAIFITLLFNPLRIKIQHWIDHHFPREHLDPDLLQETAGNFAHEMKRPLSKISFPAQLALMELECVNKGEKTWEEVFPMVQEWLRFIVNQSIEAGHVIEAIRELSSPVVAFEPVSLSNMIDGALLANKDLLEKHSISVICHLSSDLPAIPGRSKQLQIVLVNLIKNAAEAMKDLPADQKRQLRIEGESNQSHVTLRVIDTGVGVKSEDADKLFSARYSTKGHGGTGLGLYLSQQIIQGHSGTIEAFSQPGQGTTFVIKLPVSA